MSVSSSCIEFFFEFSGMLRFFLVYSNYMKLETFAFYVKTMHEKCSPQFPIKFCEIYYEVSSHHVDNFVKNLLSEQSPEEWRPKRESFLCTICAIISGGLYIFYPTFHCGLYCRAVSVTDNICAKQGNSSIIGSKIRGL